MHHAETLQCQEIRTLWTEVIFMQVIKGVKFLPPVVQEQTPHL